VTDIEFQGWPKTPRLFRDIVVTEKIDGTNAAIIIEQVAEVDQSAAFAYVTLDTELGAVRFAVAAQSRKRLITPESDNFGFATWVQENAADLVRLLGPGRHFGEWWGKGIQRGYGLDERRFSLFNVARHGATALDSQGLLHVVPILYHGPFSEVGIKFTLHTLAQEGSVAAPGFDKPEGVVVYHAAARQSFKVLLENDDIPKGLVE
jgi:hypothetical protein